MLELYELELVPATLDANVEIIFFTCTPPQDGQSTSSTAFADLTNSSNGSLQSVQINSKIGIHGSLKIPSDIVSDQINFISYVRCKNWEKVTKD